MLNTKAVETKYKWPMEVVRTILVATFAAGVIWATVRADIKTIQDDDSPNRLEFQVLQKDVSALEKKMENVPEKSLLKSIEKQLENIAPRLRNLEKDIAVIAATKEDRQNVFRKPDTEK